jgi:hypothetical protein
MNSLKNGLTGRTVLLPTDDTELYEQHLERFADDFKPVGPRETQLVHMLADHAWRLMRISSIEMTIYAAGADEFADWFDHRPPEMRPHLIQMQTYLHYEKHFRNLHLQEMRLRRNTEKDTARLEELQRERLGPGAHDAPGMETQQFIVTNRETGEQIIMTRTPQQSPVPVAAKEPASKAPAENDEFVFSNIDRNDPRTVPRAA